MLDIEDITRQVRFNCHISDARFSGYFSICGLALRLRDLYKWENRLEPWIEKDSTEILDWIGKREHTWEGLYETEFQDITIENTPYDPFDTSTINRLLEPAGIIYGAGYARGLKPVFFLAALKEKRMVDRHPVFILGKEYARDLLTIPALSNHQGIWVRTESARFHLWDKIFFITKSAIPALHVALNRYGIKDGDIPGVARNLDRIAEDEIETYVHHELGEAQDTVFDRDIWREIIAEFSHTPIDLLARAVKDLLADTSSRGTLNHVIEKRKTASLALYVAFLEGIIKVLFPQLPDAFPRFAQNKDWNLIKTAVDIGFETAQRHAETLAEVYLEGKRSKGREWTEKELEKRLLEPLRITR